jgi:hypothetical protein
MVFVLGSYVYASIGSARRNAENVRDKKLGEILESRKKLGMDEDPVAWRKRRKEDAAAGGTEVYGFFRYGASSVCLRASK